MMSTYSSKKVKLLQQFETRDRSNSKDNDCVNCVYEVIQNRTTSDQEYYVISRDGTVDYPYICPSTNIRGFYYWKDQDKIFVAYDQSIAIVTASTGVLITTLTPGFAAGTTEVGFTEFSYISNTYKVVVTDGTLLGTINSSNTFAGSVSPNIPTPHQPHPVFLDGYIFIVKSGTADIYNSDLDNPLTYTTGGYITAELLPDTLVRLGKINNYIVAFGSGSIEYFYDAANATGSPLQRNDTPVKFIGYIGGLTMMGNKAYFIGKTTTTGPELYVLEDFKIDTISIPPIRRYVEPFNSSAGALISSGGKDFYVVNIGNLTYMIDVDNKLWTRLAYKATTSFPILYSANIFLASYGNTSLVVQAGTGTLSNFQADTYLDSGVDFSPTLVTDTENFDTYNKKFCGRLSLLADQPTNGAYATISWTDDDYQTYSIGRQMPLNKQYTFLTALGSFRRRAFKIVHTGNARFRMQYLELQVNMGSM
jgi:hypothetical protein